MAKPITIKIQHTSEELEREVKKTRDGNYRLRVQVILSIVQGKETKKIQQELMISNPTIFSWIKRYNDKGLEGLHEICRGGRKEGNPKWNDAIFKALFAKLDLMEEFWSVPKMAEWIAEQYEQKIPERSIHNRLKKGGYSFKSSRPNPYKGDPELQAAFKKTGF